MSVADNGAAMRAAFDEYADQAGFKSGPDEDTGRGPAWRAWQEATRRASAREAAMVASLKEVLTIAEAGELLAQNEFGAGHCRTLAEMEAKYGPLEQFVRARAALAASAEEK